MQSSRSGPDPLDPGARGFAHRGLHGPGVPENSLAAFRAAARFNCGAECDVRLSRDNVPVVFHDADLKRMCGTPERVVECDSRWLAGRALLGTDETIPTLAQILSHWPVHLPLLIECKTIGGNGPHLADVAASALGACRRTAGIMSFDPSVSRRLSTHGADLARGLVVDAEWPADFRAHAIEQAAPQFLAVDVRLLADPWTAAMRERMPIYSWTVRTSAERAQAEVQADAVIWEGDGGPRN